MKKIYLFLLMAIAVLGVNFNAQAGDIIIECNEPNALMAGTTTADLKANTLEHMVGTIWEYSTTANSVYIKALEGYKLDWYTLYDEAGNPGEWYTEKAPSGTATGSFGIYVSAASNAWAKVYVHVSVDAPVVEEEVECTLNLINGGGNMWFQYASGRQVKDLKTGKNKLTFKSASENTITFYAPNNYLPYEGSFQEPANYLADLENGNLYCKVNGVKKDFVGYNYGVYFKPITIAAGDVVEVKFGDFSDEPEKPEITTADVTVKFADDNAQAVFNKGMAWNLTKNGRITVTDNKFTVDKGDQVRFSLNEEDYLITVKAGDTNVTGTKSGNYTLFIFAVNEDTEVTLSAKARDYGTAKLTAYITGAEYLDFHYGAEAGALLDESQIVNTGVAVSGYNELSQKVDFTKYEFTISAKTPKIFVTPKDACFINLNKTWGVKGSEKIDFGMIAAGQDSYIWGQAIDASSQLVVYYNAPTDRSRLLDNAEHKSRYDAFDLQTGYNFINFDPEYQNPFRIWNFAGEDAMADDVDADPYAYYPYAWRNGEALAWDEYYQYSGLTFADGDVLRINFGAPAKAFLSFAGDAEAIAASTLTYDYKLTATDLAKGINVFAGTYCTLTIPEGLSLMANGIAVELDANNAYSFTAQSNIGFTISNTAALEYTLTPAPGSTVENLDVITIAFPKAKNVTINPVYANDSYNQAIYIRTNDKDQTWANISYKIADKGNNTFDITFTPAPYYVMEHSFSICDGFFLVDGQESLDVQALYTIERAASFEYAFDPQGALDTDWSVYAAGGGLPITCILPEGNTVTPNWANADNCWAWFNDTPVSIFLFDWWSNYAMFAITDKPAGWENGGILKIKIGAGVLKVGKEENPEMEWQWNVKAPGTYTSTVHTEVSEDNVRYGEIHVHQISFLEAQTVEINPSEFTLRPYIQLLMGNIIVSEITDPSQVKIEYLPTGRAADNAANHIITLTFPDKATRSGEYTLKVPGWKFILDGDFMSPDVEQTFTFDIHTGIENVEAESDAALPYYNLQGVNLGTDASQLPAGIYIHAGQKVRVGK